MVFQAVTALALAALFLVAGVTKLQDIAGSRQALTDFGVPKRLIGIASFLLPTLEIVLAVGLLWSASLHPASIGTALLAFVFLVGVSYQLAKGRKPDCHCFGQLYSRPLSGWTVVRNALVLGAAAWLAIRSPLSVNPVTVLWSSLDRLSGRGLGLLVLATVCSVSLVQTFFLFEVMKQNGRLLLKLEELPHMSAASSSTTAGTPRKAPPTLPVGSPAPDFTLPSVAGQTVSLRDLRAAGKSTLLVFSDPGCGPCSAFMPELAAWESQHESLLNIAVVSRGTAAENLSKSAGLSRVLLQKDREITEAYRCQGTPGAVLVGAKGTIDSDIAHGSVQITGLIEAYVFANRSPGSAPSNRTTELKATTVS